jgi:ElaB/YqjD/DUF883 family membrane-anchored ribosome-binding protein
MQDLIQQLKDKAGLTDDQAYKALVTMKEYIHSKVPPMFAGVVDNFLGESFKDTGAGSAPARHQDDFLDRANEVTKETTQKIEGMAEEAKEEVEHFAKEATERIDEWAEKAEKAAKDAVEKLKGIMEESKK